MKNLWFRTAAIAAVLLLALIYLLPSLFSEIPAKWPKFLPKEKIHLGLDLQGGMYLDLEVKTEVAVENLLDRMADEIKKEVRKEGVRLSKPVRKGQQLFCVLFEPRDLDKLRDFMGKRFPSITTESAGSAAQGLNLKFSLLPREVRRVQKLAAAQALETIRNRVDQFGVSEPDIRPQGDRRMLIQLPGIKDPERALKVIKKSAVLEFRLVDERMAPDVALKEGAPPGTKIFWQRIVDKATGQQVERPFLLEDRVLLTGQYISDAYVGYDNFNRALVGLNFDRRGARTFERLTGENVNRKMAIVLDGNVYSAPVINEKIAGGSAQITGSFTTETARDLAIVLRAGSLPAPVVKLEERTVGPSLGKDSIDKGVKSIMVSGVLVVIFMVVYYGFSGLLADMALIINLILVLAGLAGLGATLTLPGIAGIILTIGMAVDANVLIFERIREELRFGKTPKAAVDAGYARATLTILDANITTFIAALVLFQFGTGPVRGFAVTLSLGIVASLFTAIIVTRVVFDFILAKRRIKKLSI